MNILQRCRVATVASIAFLLPFSLVAGTSFGLGGGARSYTLNNSVGKNALEFVSTAPMETINGTADGITGSFTLDPNNLEATSGSITVQVRSMKTAIAKRDGHMYSADWLDADRYPTITFALSSLTQLAATKDGGKNVVTGQARGVFTLHGVSKQITANISIVYVPEGPETKKRADGNLVLVTTTFDIPLADFRVKGKEGVVGKSVGEVIKISATLYANG